MALILLVKTMENHNHRDFAKSLMSDKRKKWHDPEIVLKNANVKEGMILADLGTGPGFFTIPMAKLTGEKGIVYAVDNNESMLNSLKENIAKSGVDQRIIKIKKSNASQTEIPKESVDIVLIANFLNGVKDRKAFFQEVRRISKTTASIIDVDWKKIQTESGPPLNERLSEEEAKQVLSDNGFIITKHVDIGPYHYELICKPTVH